MRISRTPFIARRVCQILFKKSFTQSQWAAALGLPDRGAWCMPTVQSNPAAFRGLGNLWVVAHSTRSDVNIHETLAKKNTEAQKRRLPGPCNYTTLDFLPSSPYASSHIYQPGDQPKNIENTFSTHILIPQLNELT